MVVVVLFESCFFLKKSSMEKTRVEMKPRYKSVFFLWILKLLTVEFFWWSQGHADAISQDLWPIVVVVVVVAGVFFFFQAWMIPMVMGGAVDWRVDNWKMN